MKFILTALFVASVSAPLGFCEEEKCNGKCKDKKESTVLAADEKCEKCDKCKGGDKKKEEGTLAKCDKCKDGDKKEEQKGTIA